ncbi:hypothetical protein IVB18_42920 [Bradyrhizobium sp. 186]|uniref:hypothetical protein n=1 Tax=Bradyrhizobium sp. 186 TaxID=2782654 RepID=UPI002000600A|nr:hypothetical protein [Bradyrhizobium sp. 186]UPK34688.1 hypothetical protein IVB18_42920 [Bradyrhizobium sp. 186]
MSNDLNRPCSDSSCQDTGALEFSAGNLTHLTSVDIVAANVEEAIFLAGGRIAEQLCYSTHHLICRPQARFRHASPARALVAIHDGGVIDARYAASDY